MTIHPRDIVFTRFGRPAVVTARNSVSAEVALEHDLKVVQDRAPFGIKNGLTEPQRDQFEQVRRESLSDDKKEEILRLRERIKELKEANADSKVLHYLESELQHLIVREGFVPRDYMIDERTIIKG